MNGTIPLNLQQMGELADIGGMFFTTHEWHVKHCMYMWRKRLRSEETGVTVERRSDGIEHVKHCEKIAVAGHPMKEIWTAAYVSLNADERED